MIFDGDRESYQPGGTSLSDPANPRYTVTDEDVKKTAHIKRI